MCDVTRSTIGRLASLPGSVDITKSKIFKELKVVQICQPAEQSLSEGPEKSDIFPNFQRIPRTVKSVWRFQRFTIVNTKASI